MMLGLGLGITARRRPGGGGSPTPTPTVTVQQDNVAALSQPAPSGTGNIVVTLPASPNFALRYLEGV